MNIITVKNLVRKYGELLAVNDLSFEVRKGEVFGLLGPNGAGKTTTLEILETLRPKTSGEVQIAGLNLDRDALQIKRIIGVQLQAAGYYPNLSLRELLELFKGLYNSATDPLELLELVDLTEKAKSRYKALSGGQKQRFSLATTLINKPQIIFLDEPTTGLDPQARQNLWALIRRLKGEGSTIVLTTHYMDEAETLCDRIGIMNAGRIVASGSPDSLIDGLLETGFVRPQRKKNASLEDVFLHLTGKDLRD